MTRNDPKKDDRYLILNLTVCNIVFFSNYQTCSSLLNKEYLECLPPFNKVAGSYAFSRLCPSFVLSSYKVFPCDHYPECIRARHSWTPLAPAPLPHALYSDPPCTATPISYPNHSGLLIPSGPVQTCSLEDPLTSAAIWWLMGIGEKALEIVLFPARRSCAVNCYHHVKQVHTQLQRAAARVIGRKLTKLIQVYSSSENVVVFCFSS